jgi:hypothetical protein
MNNGEMVAESSMIDGTEVAMGDFPVDPSHIGLDWFHQGFDPELQSDVGGLYDMDLFC